ncbi:MAG TPA: CsgG/HfaB family protein [Flavobacteriales bacterium]|nr:CsgG/HfaB family protein [Flavobacteriales bacterium]HRQ84080.1 CsgG/HfaB family protein [Flavobacteriales bacterium]
MKTLVPLKLIALLAIAELPLAGHAQKEKKVEVTFQDVKAKCDTNPLPRDQRVRIAVARFNVTTTNTPPELGDNMATMLESALNEMQCFRVLESKSNLGDMTQEMEGADNGLMNAGSTARTGKMLGAQLVITGEVTEFNEGSSGVRVGLVKVAGGTVHLGFILKVLDPQTRDMLWSKSVNVDGKAQAGVGLGIGMVNVVSSVKNNPALANALEKGVIQSCGLLADNWEKIDLPKSVDPNANWTVFSIANMDYGAMAGFESIVKGNSHVKSVERSFNQGIGTLTVQHTGTTQQLLDALYSKLEAKYTVADLRDGSIALRRK